MIKKWQDKNFSERETVEHKEIEEYAKRPKEQKRIAEEEEKHTITQQSKVPTGWDVEDVGFLLAMPFIWARIILVTIIFGPFLLLKWVFEHLFEDTN